MRRLSAILVPRVAAAASPASLMALLLPTRRAATTGMSGFTYAPFNNGADAYLDALQQLVEESDLAEDVNLSDGVLEIETKKGKFVLNKQAPKMQLWYSSPLSGPRHYDMVEPTAAGAKMDWTCDKDGHRLSQRVNQELSLALDAKVEMP
jgi:frataxin